MAQPPNNSRPLSPHLQVYRLPLTAITSIMTRITGQGMVPGLVLVLWWLLAAVTSPSAFACADAVLRSWFGALVLLGTVWAIWYHFLAGLRHFWFDSLRGLSIREGRALSLGLLWGSAALTLISLVLYLI